LLFQSRIFLHLAQTEPLFPVIGILEGLACGLPIIVYDMKVIDKLLVNSEIISVIENSNIQETALKTLKISTLTSTQFKKINKQAINFARRFNWKIIAEKEFRVIGNLLNY